MDNVNLLKLYEDGIVKDGNHNIKIPIKRANGDSYNGKTYMIPLDYLYYNELNGRISVALSDYESNYGKVKAGHNEEYNKVIEEILAAEDKKTISNMNILKKDISSKGQQEPGYVLLDGRVIDGNRRFTAKRILKSKTGENQYFEAVILDDLSVNNNDDLRRIKELELQIQFGKVKKVDYDPISKAMDAYNTIVIRKLMSIEDYADNGGFKTSDVSKDILEAELIIKFLEFINTNTDNYSIAKQLELDGPLKDLIPRYKEMKKLEDENMEVKLNVLFAKILQLRFDREDYKKEYRSIVKNIIGSDNENKFIDEMEDATDLILDMLDSNTRVKNNIELMDKLENDKDISKAISNVKEICKYNYDRCENIKQRNKPLNLVKQARNSIESIDREILNDLSQGDIESLIVELRNLRYDIDNLIEKES